MTTSETAYEETLRSAREAYLTALVEGDQLLAKRALDDALAAGLARNDLYLGVLEPALRDVGLLWEKGTLSVAQEHLASSITQTLMADVAAKLAPRDRGLGATAMVATTPGEDHTLGARMVADFLESDGWKVLFLGAATPKRDLVDFVRDSRPDLVALSTALTSNLPEARHTIAALHAIPARPLIAVGGHAWNELDARGSGADIFATSPETFVERARKAVGVKERSVAATG